uniref:piggyBac transposable element-derived protein 4-like isoform X1 n=1 Tax=Myxine glutinosa TaxID=7769 RepID=UPI00358F5BBC
MGCSMDGILDGDVSCEEDVNPAMLEELLFKLTDEKKVLEKEGAEVARMEEELDVKIVLKEQFLTGFLRFDKDVQEVVDTIGQKQKILNEMESGTSSEHHITLSKSLSAEELLRQVMETEFVPFTNDESESSFLECGSDIQPAAGTMHLLQDVQVPSTSAEVQTPCTSEESQDSESSEYTEPETGSNHDSIWKSHNGMCWRASPPLQRKTLSHNIMRRHPGPVPTKHAMSPKDAWSIFIGSNMLQEIAMCTNQAMRRGSVKTKLVPSEVSENELQAYFGLNLLAGYERSWDVPIRELFSEHLCNPIYHATMSVSRFEDIRRYLCFDNKHTRAIRLQSDRMAAFRYIWDLFLKNCKESFVPFDCITIDEQLVPFRGRCSFVQYMPSKPAKYGLKFFWACDSKTAYALDGIAYTGRQPGKPVQKNLAHNIVTTLCADFRGTGRNVTMDKFFTSVPLAEELLTKGLTLVGTLRKNKPHIPPVMAANKQRQRYSSVFGFRDNITMVSYVPKQRKAAILLSTLHHDNAIDEDERTKKKPEIIQYYNRTKAGVDTMDQMVRTYSCKRKSRRWPVVLWHNVMDVACLNAYILFTLQHPHYLPNVTHKRRLFMKELVLELVKPHMVDRIHGNPQLPGRVLKSLEIFGVQQTPETSGEQQRSSLKRKRCIHCPSKKDKKTTMLCSRCTQHVCKDHSKIVCNTCES